MVWIGENELNKKLKKKVVQMQRIMGRLHLLMEGGGGGIYIVVTHKEATTNTRERVKGRPDWNNKKQGEREGLSRDSR
jgi:hypothetical protein